MEGHRIRYAAASGEKKYKMQLSNTFKENLMKLFSSCKKFDPSNC